MTRRGVDVPAYCERIQKKINSDQKLNALRQLREIQSDDETKHEIQSMIDKRVAEIVNENE